MLKLTVSHLICVHSFRGGTGKSNISSNVAGQLARRGARVAVVDTDLQSPGVHALFGLAETDGVTLNDFLWDHGAASEAARDVTARVPGAESGGRLFLVPASLSGQDIARVLREGYDVARLEEGFEELSSTLNLDYLVVDTHPGLNEETLLTVTVSDTLLLALRPDQQDFQGTAVAVDVARKLEVPRLLLLLNKVPRSLDEAEVRARVEGAYRAEVAGVLPLSEEVAAYASRGLFSLERPDHPWSRRVADIASLVSPGVPAA